MAVIATFELAQVSRDDVMDRKDILEQLSRLLEGEDNAEIQSRHDLDENVYEFTLKVPVTKGNQETIRALSSFSVDAAL